MYVFGSGRCGWRGGEWMRELGLGLTNPLGIGGVLDMCLCFGCGGVGQSPLLILSVSKMKSQSPLLILSDSKMKSQSPLLILSVSKMKSQSPLLILSVSKMKSQSPLLILPVS